MPLFTDNDLTLKNSWGQLLSSKPPPLKASARKTPNRSAKQHEAIHHGARGKGIGKGPPSLKHQWTSAGFSFLSLGFWAYRLGTRIFEVRVSAKR